MKIVFDEFEIIVRPKRGRSMLSELAEILASPAITALISQLNGAVDNFVAAKQGYTNVETEAIQFIESLQTLTPDEWTEWVNQHDNVDSFVDAVLAGAPDGITEDRDTAMQFLTPIFDKYKTKSATAGPDESASEQVSSGDE